MNIQTLIPDVPKDIDADQVNIERLIADLENAIDTLTVHAESEVMRRHLLDNLGHITMAWMRLSNLHEHLRRPS